LFRSISLSAAALCLFALAAAQISPKERADSFHFVIVGDRTGEATPGVFERVLKEATATDPAFILTVGDSIEGMHDATADAQWLEIDRMLAPYKRFPIYLTPGNHDIWNERSAALFRKHSGHETHYSFDYGRAHFTVLDNSRTETYTPDEIAFLIDDLKAHAAQPLKFIISHKPAWAVPVMMNSPNFELHRIAKRFGVRYVIAGHIHAMLQGEVDGVTYISAPSAGGNLRSTKRYEDGWFYGFMQVDATADSANILVKELGEPFGRGRSTALAGWGRTGLAGAH
jgi:3',5'-cyclic AMP phosphodiesterase CpdA